MNLLNEKGWGYEKSYDASRSTVSEAVSTNEKLDYIFDLHRDSLPRKDTTIEIDGKDYAKILMVVGADYDRYEENLRSEEHTSELQSRGHLVCRLLLEKKKK